MVGQQLTVTQTYLLLQEVANGKTVWEAQQAIGVEERLVRKALNNIELRVLVVQVATMANTIRRIE